MEKWTSSQNSMKSFSTSRPRIPTINLSILESLLHGRDSSKQFPQIHAQMVSSGFLNDAFAASRLLSFSSASPCLDLEYSRRLLFQINHPNCFSWNTLMRAHSRRDFPHWALLLYRLMLATDLVPDNHTFPILLQASALRLCGLEGKQVHAQACRFGFDSDLYVVNTLVNMYSVCGDLGDARKVFDFSPVLDSVTWNSILAGYVQAGDVELAVEVFDRMPERNTIAENSMIVLFGRCGRVCDARKVFDGMRMRDRDIVTWSAMVSCYEQNEMYQKALEVFLDMRREGVCVDEIVMVSVLSACARLGILRGGKSVHGLIVRNGIDGYVNLHNALIHLYASCEDIGAARGLFDSPGVVDQISWNLMISGYVKCGLIEKARKFFNAMPQRDIVSWSTMIYGYSQHDRFSETLELFNKMQMESIRPDETTLVGVITACTRLSALEQGKWIHAYIRKNKFNINVFLGTTLVDMYMKCGCVETALTVFNEMQERGVSTWNAVILGLAMNGLIDESLQKFSEMERCGVLPNEITFVGVLGACRHAGLVDEGRRHFNSMKEVYKMVPNVKHYGCMVDLLGRTGLLREAEELVESMPMVPDVATWGALLGACKKHGDTQIGERLGKKLIELEPQHDGFHVLLSNLYASRGMWDGVVELRGLMKQKGLVKTPGCSMIESKGVVHEFLAGDLSHPQIEEINKMLNEMNRRLKVEGYEPDTSDVAFDIEEEEKETSLYRHSEKLAIAFGLINTFPPEPIRIMKNLRICGDCHAAAKIISRSFRREILIRDRRLFHHFKEGVCSCADYW